MKLNRTEDILLRAIRACPHKGFYDQVRWRFFRATGSAANITNSAKASFSRAKRNLQARGQIVELKVFPYQLTDPEFIDYATYACKSPALIEPRRTLLPIIIARNSAKELGTTIEKLRVTEEEIFGRHHWEKMKVAELDLRAARDVLTEHLRHIYDLIVPHFSKLMKSKRWENRDIEVLLCMLISLLNLGNFSYSWRQKTFIELLFLLREQFLDVFPAKLFAEASKYQDALFSYAEIFGRHRRRVCMNRHLNDFRIFERSSMNNRSAAKKDADERTKRALLERAHLEPTDLAFMGMKYSTWNSAQLNVFLRELLQVPEVEIKVLSEPA